MNSMTNEWVQPDDVQLTGTAKTCPECLNPHTVVADQQYRGLMRFCPMCDHSWIVGQVSKESVVREHGPRVERESRSSDKGPRSRDDVPRKHGRA
jgi:hypothetical protein